MTGPQVGAPAPDFTLETTEGPLRLSDLRGSKVVLIFYQEDATPTCTTQLTAFIEDRELLEELGARVVAVSADDLDAHRRFLERLGQPLLPLASDTSLEVARMYGVLDDTGKRSGRAVFVLDEDGGVVDAISPYNPANLKLYARVFRALGLAA